MDSIQLIDLAEVKYRMINKSRKIKQDVSNIK